MAASEIDTSSMGAANPNIFQLEQKPKYTLQHDRGAGAACLEPGCQCPGLELHFWRKICKNAECKHARDRHDVKDVYEMDPGDFHIGKLFDHQLAYVSKWYHAQQLHSPRGAPPPVAPRKHRLADLSASDVRNGELGQRETTVRVGSDVDGCASSNVESKEQETMRERVVKRQLQEDETLKKYTFIPPGIAPPLVHKYFAALNEEDRPLKGTDGEKKREEAFERQIPRHDIDIAYVQTQLSTAEAKQMAEFIKETKDNVTGQGHVVEIGAHAAHGHTLPFDDSCKLCRARMAPGSAAIITQHEPPHEAAYHPACFRCATCNELLVDMVYFYKPDKEHKGEGKYYCGRHFADTMYPRCSGCDELIFAREYTRAEEKNWHIFHFCCFNCDLELGGHRYMVKADQPYCIDCYMKKFAKTCRRCGKKIGPDMQRITHAEWHWHATPECFKCDECGTSMVSMKFIIKGEHVFCSPKCKTHYNAKHRSTSAVNGAETELVARHRHERPTVYVAVNIRPYHLRTSCSAHSPSDARTHYR